MGASPPPEWDMSLLLARLRQETGWSPEDKTPQFHAFRGFCLASNALRNGGNPELTQRWPTYELVLVPSDWKMAPANIGMPYYYKFPFPIVGIKSLHWEPAVTSSLGRVPLRIYPRYIEAIGADRVQAVFYRALTPAEMPPIGWKYAMAEIRCSISPTKENQLQLHELHKRIRQGEIV